ncbi:MAG TPA: hypothetical protein VM029_14780 [Opitutaceae bacterium]|nr:hypothetical protein [Opitutaceae bacterium]
MSKRIRHSLAAIVLLSLGTGLTVGAESASSPAKGSPSASKAPASSSTTRPAPGRSSTAKGPLPDPILLDGSTLPAEKRSETGMIGDFELPGDDNVRNGKVGGPQSQNPGGQPGLQTNMPMGLPQGGASQSGQQSGQQGGQQGSQSQGGGADQAGGQQAQQGAQGSQGSAGAQASAQGGAEAGGVQVGELTGEGADPGAAGKASKPQQVAIGDSAMRIDSTPPSPGVVGSQIPAGPTQQHDKGTGSGGKGAGGSGGNKGVERGRTMPSGL